MKRFLVVPALLGVAVLIAAFDDGSGIHTWLRLRAELRASQQRIAEARLEIERLRAEAAALERDAFAIERAIREDLGLARPGETILRVPPSSGSNPRFP